MIILIHCGNIRDYDGIIRKSILQYIRVLITRVLLIFCLIKVFARYISRSFNYSKEYKEYKEYTVCSFQLLVIALFALKTRCRVFVLFVLSALRSLALFFSNALYISISL